MKIDIGSRITHYFINNTIDLPTVEDPYYLINETIGRGTFINSIFRFNSDDILFKMCIDDAILTELDLSDIDSILGQSNYLTGIRSPIIFHDLNDTLQIDFNFPITFNKNIRFYAKSNKTSNSRSIKEHSIFLGEV